MRMEYGVYGIIVADGEHHQLEALKRFFDDNRDAIAIEEDWSFYKDFGIPIPVKEPDFHYSRLLELWGVEGHGLHCDGVFRDVKFQHGELRWDVRDEQANWPKEIDDPCEGVTLDHDVLTWRDECYGSPCIDIYRLIQEKFPGIKIYAANDIYSHYDYWCSDIEGRYFPVKYVYYKYDIGTDNEDENPSWYIMTDTKGFVSLDELTEYVGQHHGDIIASDEDIDRMNEQLEEIRLSGLCRTGYCVHRIKFYDI